MAMASVLSSLIDLPDARPGDVQLHREAPRADIDQPARGRISGLQPDLQPRAGGAPYSDQDDEDGGQPRKHGACATGPHATKPTELSHPPEAARRFTRVPGASSAGAWEPPPPTEPDPARRAPAA